MVSRGSTWVSSSFPIELNNSQAAKCAIFNTQVYEFWQKHLMYNHYYIQDIEFHITQFPVVSLCGQSLLLTLSLGDHISVFFPHGVYFPEWHINGIILYAVFWALVLSLIILHLRFTHAGVLMYVRFSMHLIYDYEQFTFIYTSDLIHAKLKLWLNL